MATAKLTSVVHTVQFSSAEYLGGTIGFIPGGTGPKQ
jgi:hypothetical protein